MAEIAKQPPRIDQPGLALIKKRRFPNFPVSCFPVLHFPVLDFADRKMLAVSANSFFFVKRVKGKNEQRQRQLPLFIRNT
jgi:hypothetical protein